MAIDRDASAEVVGPHPNILITPEVQAELISDAVNRIAQPDFQEGYVQEQTRHLSDAFDAEIDEIEMGPSRLAKREAKKVIDEEARRSCGLGAGRLSPAEIEVLQTKVAELTHANVLFGGMEMSYREMLVRSREAELVAGGLDYSQVELMNDTLILAEQAAATEVDMLRAELAEAVTGPGFVELMDTWANTPDSNEQFGKKGIGYHGALMHYFQYRSDRSKNRRYRSMQVDMSVQGLVEHTEPFYEALYAAEHLATGRSYVLQDSDGHERIYVWRDDGVFVVGFRHADDEKRRITTIMPGVTTRYLEKTVEDCLKGNDKGKLNRLGRSVSLIHRSE